MKPAIIVTGAAAGIGREFARIAAGEGLCLVLVDRSREPLERLTGELAANNVKVHALTIDLTDQRAGETVELELAARDLYCDVLVNNAGFGLVGRAVDIGVAEHLKLIELHILALTELTLRFLPGMIARRHGGVINVSSIAGYMAGPNMAAYNASKAYINAFTAALASEVADTGVTVTCLSPGKVLTTFWDRLPINHTSPFKLLPSIGAREVAAAGWHGFRSGKALVIPLAFYRVAAALLSVTSAHVIMRVTGGVFRSSASLPPLTQPGLKPAIVVTGASSGIGRELARLAARECIDVVLVARSRDALESLAGDIAATGTPAHVVVVDLSRFDAGETIERALVERGLYCDVVVNNAGVCLAGPAARIGLALQMKLLAVNVRSLTELTMQFLPAMVARGRGGVLNVGSIGARMAAPNMAVYHASKAYVASLSDALACETAGAGVTVTCLSPGVVRTPLVDRLPLKRGPLFKLIPTSSAHFVAEAGWRGFRAGVPLVIPSWIDRAMAWMFLILPRAAIPRVPVRD
jgi:short-subunit dehydrogenase